VDRSPTAQELFKKNKGLKVKSTGVSPAAINPLTKELVEWSDEIYVMEVKYQNILLDLIPSAKKKVKCLEIPDNYIRGQLKLRKFIIEKIKPYIDISKDKKHS
jgi:predicted protein tyrosine phosphatase